jgi:hypothetical protein
MKNLKLKDQKIADIVSGTPMYETHFNKYSPKVQPALKLPIDAPLIDDIEKNHKAQLWVEKIKNEIIMVVRVDLDVKKE